MVALKKIQACAREVAEKFHPERIVLFGSYAHGNPNKDSDIDLLVVMDHPGCAVEQAAAIRAALHTTFPVDLLVRSPAKLRERLKMGDDFLKSILEKGKVLYEDAVA